MPRTSSKDQMNHVKKPPPPAYTYYEEPTIYAQIDHNQTYKARTAGPNAVPHSSSHHQLPVQMQQHQPTMYNMAAQTMLPPGSVKTVVVGASPSQFPPVIPATSPLSSMQQHQMQQQQHQQQILLQQNHPMAVGTTTAIYPPPPPSHPNNISNNKRLPTPREIVTVRTPVAFSQQESCV